MLRKASLVVLLLAAAVSLGAQSDKLRPPDPEWVPDPSAGHYDCPDGWTAYAPSEPSKFVAGGSSSPAIYITPPLDKKGHVLGTQPSPPICVREKP